MTFSSVTAQVLHAHLPAPLRDAATPGADTVTLDPPGVDGWLLLARTGRGWGATGRLGPAGADGKVVFSLDLTEPSMLQSWMDAAAGSRISPAQQVANSAADAAVAFERTVRLLPLARAIPTLAVESYGGACPLQAEGTICGRHFYFRFRSGIARLEVGDASTDGGRVPLWSATIDTRAPHAGSLSDEAFMDMFQRLVTDLSPAPFEWKFTGTRVAVDGWTPRQVVGEATSAYSSAHTPEQAWVLLWMPPASYRGTVQQWRAVQEAKGLRQGPVNMDLRVFPARTPNWFGPAQP